MPSRRRLSSLDHFAPHTLFTRKSSFWALYAPRFSSPIRRVCSLSPFSIADGKERFFLSTVGSDDLSLSLQPYVNRVKHLTMGLGFFLLVFGASMPFLVGTYALSLLLAAVFFLMGIFGFVAGSRMRPRPITPFPGNQRTIIEVRCKSCNTLNPETNRHCAACGAPL